MDTRMRFGEFLLSYGAVKRHELAIALLNQKLFKGKIGEAIQSCGYLSDSEIDGFLEIFNLEKENAV